MSTSYVPLDPERVKELRNRSYPDGLICLNLLKFKNTATLDGEELPGAEIYQRYAAAAVHTIAEVGGCIVAFGSAAFSLIGPQDEWDSMAIVWYPSVDDFIRMGALPAYQSIVDLRTLALADSRLIPLAAPPNYASYVKGIDPSSIS